MNMSERTATSSPSPLTTAPCHCPRRRCWRGSPLARRVLAETYRAQVTAAVAPVLSRLGLPGSALTFIDQDGVWLEASAGVQPAALHTAVAEALRNLDFVADAFTAAELAGPPDQSRPFFGAYRAQLLRGPQPGRAAALNQAVAPGRRAGAGDQPRLAVQLEHRTCRCCSSGRGSVPGLHERPAGTVNMAPTLAELLGLRAPADLDGRSLAATVTGG